MNSVPASWADVQRFFDNLSAKDPQFGAIRYLTSQIARSGYALGLHPWTAMHELCICQIDSPGRHLAPHLRITSLGDGLEFRYIDTAIRERQWVRVVPNAAGFDRFVSFLDQLNWFGGVHCAADS